MQKWRNEMQEKKRKRTRVCLYMFAAASKHKQTTTEKHCMKERACLCLFAKKHKQTPAAKYTITYISQNRLPIRIVGTMPAPKVIETKNSKRSAEETMKDKRNVEEATAEIMEEMAKVFDARGVGNWRKKPF